jgi:hypothetical protein
MRLRETVLVVALGILCACSNDSTAIVPPVDHDAQGSWTWDNHGSLFPGFSFNMMLAESAGAITGTGSYSGEAAPYGSLRVSGSVRSDSLTLQIIYLPEPTVFPNLAPDTAQFVGVLATRDQIVGKRLQDGLTEPTGFVRLKLNADPH